MSHVLHSHFHSMGVRQRSSHNPVPQSSQPVPGPPAPGWSIKARTMSVRSQWSCWGQLPPEEVPFKERRHVSPSQTQRMGVVIWNWSSVPPGDTQNMTEAVAGVWFIRWDITASISLLTWGLLRGKRTYLRSPTSGTQETPGLFVWVLWRIFRNIWGRVNLPLWVRVFPIKERWGVCRAGVRWG